MLLIIINIVHSNMKYKYTHVIVINGAGLLSYTYKYIAYLTNIYIRSQLSISQTIYISETPPTQMFFKC